MLFQREFDKSGMSGFATGIDTESVLKTGISLHILRFFRYIYRSTCRKHPIKNTYRFIFKLALFHTGSIKNERMLQALSNKTIFYSILVRLEGIPFL